LRVPILVADDLLGLASEMEDALGVEFFAAVAGPATLFEEVLPPRRLGLVLGDEDRGVDPAWVARCRRSITIPMPGEASSLNVSTAAAILVYHFARRAEAPPINPRG